jgi:hypothetical protein
MAADTEQSMIPVPDPTKLTTDAVEKMRAEIMTLVDQMFKSVDRRFAEIERHRVEQKSDNQREISAALASANKTTEAQGIRVDDLNNRLTRVESERVGQVEAKGESRATIGIACTVLGAFIGLVGFLALRNDAPAEPTPVVVQVTVVSP